MFRFVLKRAPFDSLYVIVTMMPTRTPATNLLCSHLHTPHIVSPAANTHILPPVEFVREHFGRIGVSCIFLSDASS